MGDTSQGGGLVLPSLIIGIGLSGFFDGILLHQVLQWHHLLSLVPGEAFGDIGTQILADGLFHVLMYVITVAGLWLLWRRRAMLAPPHGDWRPVAGGTLLGFGLWNVIDVGFFHWILGIHRVRINVPDPMLYDLSWILALGLAPLALGWLLLRGKGGGRGRYGAGSAAILGLLTLAAGLLAARPPTNAATALVFFAPGTRPAILLDAAVAAGTPVIWMDRRGRMMAVSLKRTSDKRSLYRRGAMFVSRSPALAGCAAMLMAPGSKTSPPWHLRRTGIV